MDLEHPAISRTLKEGYPDGTGKPTNKNITNLDYIKEEEDYQMEFENMTLKELQDLGADIHVFFYNCKNKEEAQSVIEDLGLKERQCIENYEGKNHNWVKATDYSVETVAFYEEASNE